VMVFEFMDQSPINFIRLIQNLQGSLHSSLLRPFELTYHLTQS